MKKLGWIVGVLAAGTLLLRGQDPSMLDVQALRQSIAAEKDKSSAADAVPRSSLPGRSDSAAEASRLAAERERSDAAVKAAKAKETGPRRFAADLFDFRETFWSATEGGISDDYVLGVGDQVQLNAYGSATFELPLQVDGRGELAIPKVGTVRVAGLSLARARSAVQARVAQNFSRASVDLSVTRLREVRVFVMGEVYRPGSYLVPSLSSLVNVLGLAGGPTALGSYRQVRVMRGGKVIHRLDLYPLRSEGLGNLNVGLQSGDVVFVPLAANTVLLEGAFTRVLAAIGETAPKGTEEKADNPERQRLERQIRILEAQLASPAKQAPAPKAPSPGMTAEGLDPSLTPAVQAQEGPSPADIAEIQEKLLALKQRLSEMGERQRGDQRIGAQAREDAIVQQPSWLSRWQAEGRAPQLLFELLPGETAADALRYAGGLAQEAFRGNLVLRRTDPSGIASTLDLPLGEGLKAVALERGDVLCALPRRDRSERAVQLQGWVRVPGRFARPEGLRVGDLLRREGQVLPDTYLGRGEIVRTLADGRTRYLAFDVSRAVAGDAAHNLLLEDRDRVELYRMEDLRLPRTVTVTGPLTRPGTFAFHEGMRVSDLLFRAGVPLQGADLLVAELAHTREGKPSEVRRLELGRLLSTEGSSPVDLKDDALNPLLEPFDQLNLYARAETKPHRTVTLRGQVARPGVYALDRDKASLRELVQRAGGLTTEAMPQGGIFLRRMGGQDPAAAQALGDLGLGEPDPTSNGINEILGRLSETKRQPSSGVVLRNPLLHGLRSGALNRLVVDLPSALAGEAKADVELMDGDEIIVPRRTDAAYVVGETASPFAVYKVLPGMTVRDLLEMAGGTTRNADTWNIRLLKADGRVLDRRVNGQKVEPGDAVLVPQRIRRDSTWQENLNALTPIALILNAILR